ncbi:MAG: hypothetical protein ACOY0T_21575 [Myxococcota bacterium]
MCFVLSARRAAAETCPDRPAVEEAVRTLLGRSELRSIERQFDVQDLGERYVVTALDRSRSYDDAARDCDRRAEVAAVFIALTLAPPEIAPGSAAAEGNRAAVGQREGSGRATGDAKPVWKAAFELGTRTAFAPRSDGSEFSLGGELGASLGRGAWGMKALVGLESSLGWELASVPVNERRLPVALALRHEWAVGGLRAAGELGPTLSWLWLRQANQGADASVSLRQWGGRAAGSLALAGKWAPYVAVSVEYLLGAHDVLLEPRGRVGETSAFRMGAALGVVAAFP